jgi:hypothetical protein
LGRDVRDLKVSILAQIQSLDARADSVGLNDEGWALHYHLEGQLTHMARFPRRSIGDRGVASTGYSKEMPTRLSSTPWRMAIGGNA